MRIPQVLLFLLASACLFQPAVGATQFSSTNILKSRQAKNVVVVAHRGCWGKEPEVSISAIEACKSVGADVVEVDVRMSRDGVLILMHDDTVDRTTDGKGPVAGMTVADIQRLKLKQGSGGPAAPLTNEHVPTLEEALAAARGHFLVNVHLKAPVDSEVAALVRRMDMVGQVTTWVTAAPEDASLVRSPLRGAIGIIPTINDCSRGYPTPCWPTQIHSLDDYASLRPVAFFLDFRQTHDFIRAIAREGRPAGTRIFVETLNNEDKLTVAQRRAEWERLIHNGVDMILTNHPQELVAILNSGAPLGGSRANLQPH